MTFKLIPVDSVRQPLPHPHISATPQSTGLHIVVLTILNAEYGFKILKI